MNEPNSLKFNSLYQLQKKGAFKEMSTAQKAFVLKYISPLGYYPWHKMAFGMALRTEKRKEDDGQDIMSAPAYYLTDELTKAFINTPINKLKLDKEPNIINKSFFIFQSLDINLAAYSLVECWSNQFGNHIHVKVASKSGSRFNRSTGITFSKKGQPTISFSINWRDLQRISNVEYKNASKLHQQQFNIIANFILFMNQQPDITYEKVPPSVTLPIQINVKRQDRFQPRPVTWIGKDFTERVIKIKPESDELLVRHPGKPKRSHWRRGHWHTILQGPKRKQRRMKWYQPVFIMGNRA